MIFNFLLFMTISILLTRQWWRSVLGVPVQTTCYFYALLLTKVMLKCFTVNRLTINSIFVKLLSPSPQIIGIQTQLAVLSLRLLNILCDVVSVSGRHSPRRVAVLEQRTSELVILAFIYLLLNVEFITTFKYSAVV